MSKQTRRKFLAMTTVSTASLPLIKAFSSATVEAPQEKSPGGSVSVHITAGDQRYSPSASLAWQSANRAPAADTIVLRGTRSKHPVLGFGAALTDAACYVISQMPEAERERLLQELFHPDQMGLSVCRLCIGSSDYARTMYSFDEGAPDPELTRFSIAHDREYILPALRRARAINSDLFLLGSPWSPPGWMKDNNSMLGGTLRRRYLGPYANYIVKFLQAYEAEGVHVDAVSPQNEVDTDQDSRMPACLLPQEIEVEYVGQHLGPALQKAGLKTKIWLVDHNYNLWGRAICELDDEKVSTYTKSIAWHGYLGQPDWVQKVLAAHPEAEMYWTEGGPDIIDPKYLVDWAKWSKTFAEILRNGMRCIIGWNIALDENGKPNIGPFPCGGVVTVHSGTNEIIRSGQYWGFAHYSRTFRRGSAVIQSDGEIKDVHHVVAENPDGSRAAVLTNTGSTQRTVWLRQGKSAVEVSLPGDSVITLGWS
ncbi:MAG TPA: glycoside hydrolase family 30 beta sandwich domain-containing protein [Candidatus Angelobacter sp.]|nr:glycoside hydrolase family 30 beta sandwich domain-containing protein [Candidatus Angelobacter sp.]